MSDQWANWREKAENGILRGTMLERESNSSLDPFRGCESSLYDV